MRWALAEVRFALRSRPITPAKRARVIERGFPFDASRVDLIDRHIHKLLKEATQVVHLEAHISRGIVLSFRSTKREMVTCIWTLKLHWTMPLL